MKNFNPLKRFLLIAMIIAGCSSLASAQPISVAVTGPLANCSGDSTVLGVNINGPLNGPYTYLWNTGATTSTIIITGTGFRRVTVTGTDNNGNTVSSTSPWRFFLFFNSPSPTITASGSLTICDGEKVTLTANGGNFFSGYLWSTGATTQSIDVSQTGDYWVTITNATGCSGTSAMVHVEVLDPSFQPPITALTNTVVCQPAYVHLKGPDGYLSYSWSTGQTTQQIAILMDGTQAPILDTLTVTCTVAFSATCSFTSEPIVLRSIRQPELLPPYCNNYNLTMNDSVKTGIIMNYNNPSEYEFEFENTAIPGVIWTHFNGTSRWLKLADVNPPLAPFNFYNVRVRGVIDGSPYCYGDVCQIGVMPSSPSIVKNHLSAKLNASEGRIELNAYPNPSQGAFNLYIVPVTDENVNVSIIDLSGRLVESSSYGSGEQTISIGQDLKAGIYFVEVSQGSNYREVTRISKIN
ncbi:MAG TPA: T9SS type A sorting domain-containing protein [Bacteroidia bacterium]|nr:T9SS type A sorting domain-containing protein [Bacteroidia bacterium]HNT80564.1 T9SS type A sorting domain-containing protein [Bacteroidia bacterium]